MTIEQFKADLTKYLPDSIYIKSMEIRDGLVVGALTHKGEEKSFVFVQPISLSGVAADVAKKLLGQLQ